MSGTLPVKTLTYIADMWGVSWSWRKFLVKHMEAKSWQNYYSFFFIQRVKPAKIIKSVPAVVVLITFFSPTYSSHYFKITYNKIAYLP